MTGIWTRARPLRKTNARDAFSGVNPSIAVSRMLVAYAVPMKANMPTTVTMAFTANARCEKKSSRSSGAADLRSARMNSARKTAATVKPATTCRLPQPLVGAWITANSSANSAIATVTCPGQSSDRPAGAAEFWAMVSDTAALARARTITAINAQRQLA